MARRGRRSTALALLAAGALLAPAAFVGLGPGAARGQPGHDVPLAALPDVPEGGAVLHVEVCEV